MSNTYQNIDGGSYSASLAASAPRLVNARANFDFNPQTLPLVSPVERIARVSDIIKKGPVGIWILGWVNVILAIGAGIGGNKEFGIAHGVFGTICVLLGAYVRFAGTVRRVLTLTTHRVVYREASKYPGFEKKIRERSYSIKDVAVAKTANVYIDWILLICLFQLVIGCYTFTRDRDGVTIFALIVAIILACIYISMLVVYGLRRHKLYVRFTRAGAWQTLDAPMPLDDAFELMDTLLQLRESALQADLKAYAFNGQNV